jgi:Zn-dependent protease/CBS domain-containing protein
VVTLARIGGVAIRADASWAIVVALVTWSFWDRFDHDRRFGGSAAFLMALATAALFFGSVLAHEVAHALEAQRRGVPVGGITLFLFGGATEMSMEARRPIDEFALTAVGPFTSLTLGAMFGLAATAADHAGLTGLAEIAGVLGWLNTGLAIFNLLPGAPLDGGRIVRALAWKLTGDRDRATAIAGGAGQVLGGLLLALGLSQVFFVPTGFTTGLWWTFLGWFLMNAAGAERAEAGLRRALRGAPVRRFASRAVDPVPADASVPDAIDGWFRVFDREAFLVTEDPAPIVGVVSLDDVRKVPPEARHRLRVRDIMRSIDELPWVDADRPASAVLDQLVNDGVAVVFDDSTPMGLLTRRELLARIRRDQDLGALRAEAA